MNNKIYDIIKWTTTVVLPAIATFYFVLSGIWNLPYTEQILGTFTALETFLGTLIGINYIRYHRMEKENNDEELF